MNNVNDKKVARIIDWNYDPDGGNVRVVTVERRDGSQDTLNSVLPATWNNIKAEELEYELAERNAEVITTPETREVVHGTVTGRITPESRQEVRIERQTIIDRCRLSDSIVLCAWCQTYHGKVSLIVRLNDDEFEATRHTGESHGICDQCKDAQIAALKDSRKKRDADRIEALTSALADSEQEVIVLMADLDTMRRQRDAYRASATDLQTKLDEKTGN